MSSAQIVVEDVSVFFPLYHGNARSLKKTVISAASGRLGKDRNKRIVVQALRDISLELRGGDRLGLVGSNGAGKTTLLRTLAGIYEPVNSRFMPTLASSNAFRLPCTRIRPMTGS